MSEIKKPELENLSDGAWSSLLMRHDEWIAQPKLKEKVDFSRYNLREKNFSNDNLSYANFSGLDFTGTNFSEATLVGTKFLNAIMHGADLRETKTAGMQLGGADVTNAILPDEIKSFDGLKTVEEASKIAKRLFTMLLTALGYSALTIFSTKDYDLLINSPTLLPIIQTPVPRADFYWIAPILLTAFFIYFLLNLLHLYKLISRLPAVFPDGTPLDEKIFPWLLNTLVWEYFPVLAREERSLFRVRKLLIVFLIWLATPFTLFWFWFGYLRRHDLWWSCLHILWVGFVTFFAIEVYNKTTRILKRDPNYEWSFEIRNYKLSLTCINQIAGFFVLIFIVVTFVPGEFNIPKWPNANFAEQEVSHKPDNWNPEKPAEGVKGANLEGANLDYADARSAFLVRAKLKKASLKHADLTSADLDHADASNAVLVEAKLIGASLKYAILTGADLTGAKLDDNVNLTNAHLNEAHLIGAKLTQAILSGADFTRADLTSADLSGADLTGADLTDAKLVYAKFTKLDINVDHKKLIKKTTKITPTQIKSAKNWQLAVYDRSFNEEQLRLTDPEISSALKLFIKESSPTLSNEEVGKLYEKEMKQYRVHYGWPTGEKTK